MKTSDIQPKIASPGPSDLLPHLKYLKVSRGLICSQRSEKKNNKKVRLLMRRDKSEIRDADQHMAHTVGEIEILDAAPVAASTCVDISSKISTN